jgi:hypothetical protein
MKKTARAGFKEMKTHNYKNKSQNSKREVYYE